MGYAERRNRRVWRWLYSLPLWRRLAIALLWFVPARNRARFQGLFWGWVTARGSLPSVARRVARG